MPGIAPGTAAPTWQALVQRRCRCPYNQPSNVISGLVAGKCNPPDAKVPPLPAADSELMTFTSLDVPHVWAVEPGRSGRRRLVHQPGTETGPVDAKLTLTLTGTGTCVSPPRTTVGVAADEGLDRSYGR